MTAADSVHKRKQEHSNSDFTLSNKIPKLRDQKRVPGNDDFLKQLNVIQGIIAFLFRPQEKEEIMEFWFYFRKKYRKKQSMR